MEKTISRAILRMTGWKLDPVDGMDSPKCIVCMAPHTSSWDLIVGGLFHTPIGCNAGFLIKKEWFFFPFNLLFSWLGGVPVDRNKRTSVTDQMVKRFKTSERFQLTITPGGTRKRAEDWKKGSYFIALRANVPTMMVYSDYKKKEVDTKGVFYPTGNADKDIHTIHEMYRGIAACHPENFV